MNRHVMAVGLCALLGAPAMASSDSIQSGPYEVFYGGSAVPVDSGNVAEMGLHGFCTDGYGTEYSSPTYTVGTYVTAASALPWKPLGRANSYAVCNNGYLMYEAKTAATLGLSQGMSIGYFAHLKGTVWTTQNILFSLWSGGKGWSTMSVYFNKGIGSVDSLTVNDPYTNSWYVLVADSLGKQLFDPKSIETGWVAVEARVMGDTSSTLSPNISLSLANRPVWFRIVGGTGASSMLKFGWPPNGTNAWAFSTQTGMDTVGDAAMLGPITDADYEWARNRFFGVSLLQDTSFSKPYIRQVIYNPPGDLSYQQLTNSTSFTSMVTTNSTNSSSLYFGSGIDVTPEVLSGEVGVSMDAKVTAAQDINNGSAFSLNRTVSQDISTPTDNKNCDLVLYDNVQMYGALLGHPRLDKVFATNLQTGVVTNGVVTTPSDYVASFQLIPWPVTGDLTPLCADQYLAYVRDTLKDTGAVRNFHNLYVKDSLGNINTTNALISNITPSSYSLTGSWSNTSPLNSKSITNQTTSSTSQSYAFSLGTELNAKITAGGASVLFGGSYTVKDEREVSTDSIGSQSVGTYFGDGNAWDAFKMNCYENDSWGLYVCQPDSETSWSSGPWERNTQKAVDLAYSLKEATGNYTVGDTVVDTLVITNNSNQVLTDVAFQIALDGAQNVLTPFTAIGNTWGQYNLPAKGQSVSIPLEFTPVRARDTATLVVDAIVGHVDNTMAFTGIFTDTVAGRARALVDARSVTSILVRPARVRRATELSAYSLHPLATQVSGVAEPYLNTGSSVCDGNNCLSLSLSLPSASSVSVSIFDNLGDPVISWSRDFTGFDLAQIRRGSDGRYPVTLTWNLRAANGVAVAPGVYLWKIGATTFDGQKLETVKKMGVK